MDLKIFKRRFYLSCRVSTLLGRPGKGELVWDKVPVNVDNFQLSEDGRLAGGNFPWPEGGVAELPNKSIQIFTKGCWPSFITVNGRPFYWIFDGSHRNLTIFDLQKNKKWQVSINGATGIEGHEVYFPRWSNDPRIMAITGPFNKDGKWYSRDIEVYVGRFSADFTKIESWWKATHNDRADFYPDVWVAPKERAKHPTAKVADPKKTKTEKLRSARIGQSESRFGRFRFRGIRFANPSRKRSNVWWLRRRLPNLPSFPPRIDIALTAARFWLMATRSSGDFPVLIHKEEDHGRPLGNRGRPVSSDAKREKGKSPTEWFSNATMIIPSSKESV